ncbi:MAG: hypothetical protein H6654_17650 [Ardenticatenaceae bacterium]|nr:hypothetical protein [Ardenticatenaceae bacterium]
MASTPSPAPQHPALLAEDTSVTFYFDNQTGWVTDSINSLIANVPGSFKRTRLR